MTSRGGGRARRWLLAAALVAAGAAASPSAVPVYDGVGNPDQPYRSSVSGPAPRAAHVTAPLQDGQSAGLRVSTPESGPQALLDVSAGTFRAPGTSLGVDLTPLAPDTAPPRGTVDGNVYRVSATPAGSTTSPHGQQDVLSLRAAVMVQDPFPVIVYRASPTAPWREVKTVRSGNDVLATAFQGLGDYAVVRLPGAKKLSNGGLSPTRAIALGLGVLALLVITVLALRRQRPAD